MAKVKQRPPVSDILIPTPTVSNGEADASGSRDGGIDVLDCVNGRKKGIGHNLLRHLSPRAVISRFSKLTRNRSLKERGGAKEIKDRGDVSTVADDSAAKSKEVNFNVGVRLGLFFLTAATSKNEINKMAKLREEMEIMVESVKELLKKKDSTPPTNNVSVSTKFEQAKEMNQLEAELESELQQLEYHLNMEASLQQQSKVEVNVDDTGPRESLSTMYGEPEEEEEEGTGGREGQQTGGGGVVAEELERRLREVMEVRQEERIKELEFELREVRRKALDKDLLEAFWSRRVAQQNGSPGFTSLFQPKEKTS